MTDNEKAVALRSGELVLEKVVIGGDLSKLTPAERVSYYRTVTESMGLNPYTKPFDYLNLNGKLVLYANRAAAEQLRKLHGIAIEKLERDYPQGLCVVTAYARDREGRTDVATGAVAVANLKGEALANAVMKAETKAKRRVTLSLAGLGWLDESEVGSIPNAHPVQVDETTGEIVETPSKPKQAKPAQRPPVDPTPASAERPVDESGTVAAIISRGGKPAQALAIRVKGWLQERGIGWQEAHELVGVDSFKAFAGTEEELYLAIEDAIAEAQGAGQELEA